MGSVNGFGVYEYDRTDGSLGPALLNLQSSALSTAFGGAVPIARVANVTARGAHAAAYAATRGAISPANPCVVWRADADTDGWLEYTVNGSTWQTVVPGKSSAAVSYSSGWGSGAVVHATGGVARIAGNISRTSANFTLTGSFTQVAHIPAGFRPSGIAYNMGNIGSNLIELAIGADGVFSIRTLSGSLVWAPGQAARLSGVGAWPIGS